MYRLIDHKQNILRPKGDQSFHTVWAQRRPSALAHFCPLTSYKYNSSLPLYELTQIPYRSALSEKRTLRFAKYRR